MAAIARRRGAISMEEHCMSSYRLPPVPTVDAVGAETRAAEFTTRSIKTSAKQQALAMITGMIDLTTLEGADTRGKVARLCRKGLQPLVGHAVPPVAAICVYPTFVATAKECLAGSPVEVASGATAFPSGQSSLATRLDEVRAVVADGADEVDVVINRGAFLAGRLGEVYDEIVQFKEACGPAELKVILETGELETYDKVRIASQVAMDAGADFIKTSTGKVQPAATLPVTLVMLEAVRDHYWATGRKVGVKAAGGIKTAKHAWHYLVAVKETLGDAWLTPAHFRIGASSLLGDVLRQWLKLETGVYASADSISID
jgi:deoxyribose-phosphate aldolase